MAASDSFAGEGRLPSYPGWPCSLLTAVLLLVVLIPHFSILQKVNLIVSPGGSFPGGFTEDPKSLPPWPGGLLSCLPRHGLSPHFLCSQVPPLPPRVLFPCSLPCGVVHLRLLPSPRPQLKL